MTDARFLVGARLACAAIGVVAAASSVISYSAPGTDGTSPNSSSSEFGAMLHDWAGFFLLATLFLGTAILLSRGSLRWLLIVLMIVIWVTGIQPARHYFDYYHGLP